MILHPAERTVRDGAVRIAARVECATRSARMPPWLWFEVAGEHAALAEDRADGFLAAVLLGAMAVGESIDVRGPVSPRLLEGVQRYQEVLATWRPQALRHVDVRAADVSAPRSDPAAVLCPLSGGVDSLFTLLRHLPEHEPEPARRVTHALLVHGLDIRLRDTAGFMAVERAYGAFARRHGLGFVIARTNSRKFGRPVSWSLRHGAGLIAVPLVLAGLARRFLVASADNPDGAAAWGSHRELDRNLSTETLEVVSDSVDVRRIEKVAALAQWRETYPLLRVCLPRPRGLVNCGRCEKCVRTMVDLEVVGALDLYETFPRRLTARRIRRADLHWDAKVGYLFARQSLRVALERRRYDVALQLALAMGRNSARRWSRKLGGARPAKAFVK